MKAQDLNKHLSNLTQEGRQDFVNVQGEVFVKLHKAIDDMKTAGVLPIDAKEIYEYGLRVGQFMTITEIFTGFNLDAKEDNPEEVILEAKDIVLKEVINNKENLTGQECKKKDK